jgi:hypothetical protein
VQPFVPFEKVNPSSAGFSETRNPLGLILICRNPEAIWFQEFVVKIGNQGIEKPLKHPTRLHTGLESEHLLDSR